MVEHESFIMFIGNFVTAHPEILLALLLPAVHYWWKRVKNKYDTSNRKQSLRQQIKELLKQRESLAKVAEIEHGQRVLDDIESDLKAVITALIPAQTGAEVHPAAHRNMLVRWFLLYKPSGGFSWVLHALFFLNIAIIVLGLIGTFFPWDKDSPAALGGIILFLIPAYFLAALSHHVERRRLLRAASS